MMEGVALSIRDNLAIIGKRRCPHRQVAGGRRLLPQSAVGPDHRRRDGHTIVTMHASETETLGTAILAGVGTGAYGSFVEARERTLSFEGEFPPRAEYAALYDGVFRLYKQLYEDLRPRFAEAARLYQG